MKTQTFPVILCSFWTVNRLHSAACVSICCFHVSFSLFLSAVACSLRTVWKTTIKMLIIEFYWISIQIRKWDAFCNAIAIVAGDSIGPFHGFLPFSCHSGDSTNRISLTSSSVSIKCTTKSMHVSFTFRWVNTSKMK